MTDEVIHMNLWHRMIQLRDNYIILYESLFDDTKFGGQISQKQNLTDFKT